MNTEEIQFLVQGTGTRVCASDQLPKHKVKNDIYIVNTDSIKKEGQHWILVAKLGDLLIYGDPLGAPPFLKPFVRFINLNMEEGDTLKFNRYPFQGENTSNCGKYTTLLAWHLHFGRPFEQFCQLFSAEPEVNDRVLEKKWKEFIVRSAHDRMLSGGDSRIKGEEIEE